MKPNSFFQAAFPGTNLNHAKTRPTGRTAWYIPTSDAGKLINFGSGEVDQSVSSRVLSVIRQVHSSDLVNYPDSSCHELKISIGRKYGVAESMISVGNGSDEIIENIPRVFLEPKDACLCIVPTFFRFIESCQRMKGEVITVATRKEDKFMLTPSTLMIVKTAIEKHQPKIIWIDSPNSITGAVTPLKTVRQILSWSKKLVVVDEVHHELADPANCESAVQLLPTHNNLILIKSVSKAFGLAGVRLGFALAQTDIVNAIERWRLTFTVNAIAQRAAVAALSDNAQIEQTAKSVKSRREHLFSRIERIPGFAIGAPSKTHLFILKHENFDLFEELVENGILAVDLRHARGLENKGFVRLNIKTPGESQILLKALSDIYNGVRKI